MSDDAFTLAVAQTCLSPGDTTANLTVMSALTGQAAACGADLILFPELAPTCYGVGAALRDLAEPADGPSFAHLAEAARDHGIAVCYGYAERDGAERVGKEHDGTVLYNSAALAGAELIAVPTATVSYDSTSRFSEMVIAARATENNVFVAYANHRGSDGDYDYMGKSIIAGPLTDIYALAGAEPALLIARLDRARLAEGEARVPYRRDRRPELYGDL